MIIILPETSIRISRNKSIINYISCVEIQSAQGENTGTWTDQISIQFPDTTDPLKLGPIIIDVKQSNCQSHFRLTSVKSIKKSDQLSYDHLLIEKSVQKNMKKHGLQLRISLNNVPPWTTYVPLE